MTEQPKALRDLVTPLLDGLGLDLYDLEVRGAALVLSVDRAGGVDLDAIAEATRVVSHALDQADPIAGRYTLEVTSRGLERRLRTPEHFVAAIGETVSVRTLPGVPGPRRVTAALTKVDATGIELAATDGPDGPIYIAFRDIERARTVFAWGAGPAPSPSRGRPTGHASADTERVTTP